MVGSSPRKKQMTLQESFASAGGDVMDLDGCEVVVDSTDGGAEPTQGSEDDDFQPRATPTTAKAKMPPKPRTPKQSAAAGEAVNGSEMDGASSKPPRRRTSSGSNSKKGKAKEELSDGSQSDSSLAPMPRQAKVAQPRKRKPKAGANDGLDGDSSGDGLPTTIPPRGPPYNKAHVAELAAAFPDPAPLGNPEAASMLISAESPLNLVPSSVIEQGPIVSMSLSAHGTILATFSVLGLVKLWDTDSWQLIQVLRDQEEENIDEFYCGAFLPDGRHLAVGGKHKNRKEWSLQDDDNHILPCSVKIFDVVTSKVVSKLDGHVEEVLSVQGVWFKGEYYLISTSQDGFIIKWKMNLSSLSEPVKPVQLEDGITCMAFGVSFLPNTGNKYFVAGADEDVRLFDFETGCLIQGYDVGFSSYCDCVRLASPSPSSSSTTGSPVQLIARGVELVENPDAPTSAADQADDSPMQNYLSKPNTCVLVELVFPSKNGGRFALKEIRRLQHADYHANSWLAKIASNGRYVAAPTVNGKVFIFDLEDGSVAQILEDHEDREVRDVVFHPFKPQLLTCADDGHVNIYAWSARPGAAQ